MYLASLRIAVDGASNFLRRAASNTLKIPDIICGDFDSVSKDTLEMYGKQGSKIIVTPDQDETDFTKAVLVCLDAEKEKQVNYDVILVVNTVGGRPDHVLSNFHTLHRFVGQCTPLVLCDIGCSASWVIQPGICHKISRQRTASWCCLVPLTGESVVNTTGLKWNLNNQILKFGQLISTSNAFDDTSSLVTVKCDSPLLWSMDGSNIFN